MSLSARYTAAVSAVILFGMSMAHSEPAAATDAAPAAVEVPSPAPSAPPGIAEPQANTNTADAPPELLTSVRDPFWPVGFSPVPVSEKQVSERVSRIRELTQWPKLELRGITRTGKGEYIAILNGIGLVEPGDIISMRRDGLIYRWRVNDITAAGISRTRLDVREPMSAPQPME